MANDWLAELSDDDMGVLVEALESWEQKGEVGELMGELFTGLLAKDDIQRAELKAKQADERAKREREKVMRKERSIVLRAKLLTIRDRRRVEGVCASIPVVA